MWKKGRGRRIHFFPRRCNSLHHSKQVGRIINMKKNWYYFRCVRGCSSRSQTFGLYNMTVHPKHSIFFYYYYFGGERPFCVRDSILLVFSYEQEFLSIIFYNLKKPNDFEIRLSKDFVLFLVDTDVSPVIPNTNNSQTHRKLLFPVFVSIAPSANIMSNWIRNNMYLYKKTVPTIPTPNNPAHQDSYIYCFNIVLHIILIYVSFRNNNKQKSVVKW